MEKYLISEQKLVDIADAIREKTGSSEPIVVSQMDEAIREISGENLDSELSTQDDLIAQISSALEGKTAGGGSDVDTCTVIVNCWSSWKYAATVYDNDTISTEYVTEVQYESKEINNVVCNSMFVVHNAGANVMSVEGGVVVWNVCPTMESLYTDIIRIDAPAGGTVTINCV